MNPMSRKRKKKAGAERRKEPSKPLDSWIAFLVALVTFAVFFPALRNEFVNWDDYELLVDNPRYRGLGWEQVRWMFSTFHNGHYQPLSWMTFALDYLIWGMEPFGYHLTNLVLHAANTALFYFLALRLLSLALSRPPSASDLGLRTAAGFAALFFSIHPLRVESVAWATERRDVLSGLFFLATILCYLQAMTYSNDPSHQARWRNRALIAYGLSLLAKASGVTLPVVLLVLDVYPLRRLGGGPGMWLGPAARCVWWEKVPFFLLAAGVAVIAPLAQSEAGAVAALRIHGIAARLSQSLYGLAFYLWKTILPTDLSPFYEVPRNLDPLAWPFLLSGAVVVALTIGLFVLRHRWPAGLASWICYVAIVAPVLGFVQSGRQMVADRYSYLSCLVWAILLGGGLYYVWKRNVGQRRGDRKSSLLITGAALILIALGVLTWRQVEIWHDSDRLWNHVLAITDRSIFRSGTAHHFVARVFADRGDLDRAIEHLRISINIEPTDSTAYMDLGTALAKKGQLNEAIKNFQNALALNPTLSLAHYSLANALAVQGHLQEAAARLEEALRLKPNYAEAYVTLGKVFAVQGQLDKAIGLFRQALQIRPDLAEGHQSLAMALAEKGWAAEANYHYQEARRIIGSRPEAEAVR
jgi:tetratricopeptide (TPR) repeat protein